jgi:hypothetical protein
LKPFKINELGAKRRKECKSMSSNTNKDEKITVEIRPNEFEVMADRNVRERGENAGFFIA